MNVEWILFTIIAMMYVRCQICHYIYIVLLYSPSFHIDKTKRKKLLKFQKRMKNEEEIECFHYIRRKMLFFVNAHNINDVMKGKPKFKRHPTFFFSYFDLIIVYMLDNFIYLFSFLNLNIFSIQIKA